MYTYNFPLDNIDEEEIYLDVDESDRKILKEDLLNNNISFNRTNEDKGVNENGRILIRLSSMSSMLILNGRFGNDKGIGRKTYCEIRNNKLYASTVDYVLCTRKMLYNISNFDVKDFNAFSDHAAINFDIKCHFLIVIQYLPNQPLSQKSDGERKIETSFVPF